MKIALCLSGQPRYMEIGFESLNKNILSKYEVDVFSHIWFDENIINDKIDLSIPYNRICTWEPATPDKIYKLYSPRAALFECPKLFNLEKFTNANFEMIAPNNVLSMFYSMSQANNLKKSYEIHNNFIYDIVIRARTDLDIINFDIDLTQCDLSKIHCSSIGSRQYKSNNICNDQFAFSNSTNMDIYSNIIDNLEYYFTVDGCLMVGEVILTHHLINKKIPVHTYTDNLLNIDIYKG